MVQLLKRYCWLAVLGLCVLRAPAFSLLGPYETWQVPEVSYQEPGDLGGPHNLGEEFRRNTPTMYYAFDQNFLDYFGSNGVVAIQNAFSVYNALTNVSSYSSDLSEWPMESTRVNYRAQALGLYDLKSATLSLLSEQLGLAEPERWTWCLHDRLVGAAGCPASVAYTVIKRNFEPVSTPLNQLLPTSYVNGTRYSYYIQEFCVNTPWLADAVEFKVDPLAIGFSSVASFEGAFSYGNFYVGLTRDDVGGLRYLMQTNNMNIETAGPGTITFVTNSTANQLLYTSNYTRFSAEALTNNAAALSALYPDLLIANTTPFFTNVIVTNVTFYFTNSPYDPVGSLPRLISVTNLVPQVATYYRHDFANVIVVSNHLPSGSLKILTTNISASACGPYAPAGSICTNITLTTVTNNHAVEFYIIPTNLCALQIVSTQLVQTVFVTNQLAAVTNQVVGETNTLQQEFSRSTVESFTQYIYVVHPVTCPTNHIALRQGIEQIRFERRDYDSLLNQFYQTVTNEYVLNSIANNVLVPQKVRRVVNRPDILLTAQDFATTVGDNVIGSPAVLRNIEFNANNTLPNLAGPGTIDPFIVFTYNKVGPIYLNTSPSAYFLLTAEASQSLFFIWGSYDGSTNAPVVFPNGVSIANLENQVLFLPNPPPPDLPAGTNGVAYSVQFTVSGALPPHTWSLSPESSALPPGLSLSSGGLISGVPSMSGTFDFAIRLTDGASRVADWAYTITINP